MSSLFHNNNHNNRYITNVSSPIAEGRTGRILAAVDRLFLNNNDANNNNIDDDEKDVALKFVFSPNSERNGLSHPQLRESAVWALLTARAEMKEEKEKETKNEKVPILKLRDVFSSGASVVYVSKRMKSDLHSFIVSSKLNNNSNNTKNNLLHVAKSIMCRILEGLDFMHRECNVVHRDLKTQNIFVDYEEEDDDKNDHQSKKKQVIIKDIVIGDFGLSRCCSSSTSFDSNNSTSTSTRPMTHEVVTRAYRPPELFLGCCRYYFANHQQQKQKQSHHQRPHPATSIDMWSFGCIAVDLLMNIVNDKQQHASSSSSSSPLFASSSSSDLEQLSKMYDLIGTPSSDVQQKLKKMANKSDDNDYDSNNSNGFFVSFTPRPPYHPKWGEEVAKLYLLSGGKNDDDDDTTDEVKTFGDFIQRLLCNDPNERMTAKECLEHPFLSSSSSSSRSHYHHRRQDENQRQKSPLLWKGMMMPPTAATFENSCEAASVVEKDDDVWFLKKNGKEMHEYLKML